MKKIIKAILKSAVGREVVAVLLGLVFDEIIHKLKLRTSEDQPGKKYFFHALEMLRAEIISDLSKPEVIAKL